MANGGVLEQNSEAVIRQKYDVTQSAPRGKTLILVLILETSEQWWIALLIVQHFCFMVEFCVFFLIISAKLMNN